MIIRCVMTEMTPYLHKTHVIIIQLYNHVIDDIYFVCSVLLLVQNDEGYLSS